MNVRREDTSGGTGKEENQRGKGRGRRAVKIKDNAFAYLIVRIVQFQVVAE